MRKHMNTLFVATQGAYLAKEGLTVLVRANNEKLGQIPVHTLDGIVCFGQVSCSPYLMHFCAEENVGISFMNEYGKFLARVQGPVSGNVLLRREQYRRADDMAGSARIARSAVIGKISNCRAALRRAVQDHADKPGADEIQKIVLRLGQSLKQLRDENLPLETVRGLEGSSAADYFSVFDHLILSDKKAFFFKKRSRRPPLDNVNCLLSFIYTILNHDVRSALETVGLDPAVGFLHRDRPGRPGLALDLMEEFRPFIADRLVLSLINRKQLTAKGFKKSESGAVVMTDATRKLVLTAYQERKQEEITHPFLDEKMPVGLLFHMQASLMARHLRGDLDSYPPFVVR